MNPSHCTVLLAVVLLAGAIRAQGPAGPSFTAGDLAVLEAKVVDCKAIDASFQRLVVEVQNRGAVEAEPLEFRVELPARKGEPPIVETFSRVQLPAVARHGRPVPAGGKQTYQVSTALPGKKGQFRVAVTAASFGSGLAVAKPDLRIGEPVQVQRTSLAGTFPVTQVTLHNPLDREIDVMLSVTLKQPVDSVELYGVRLPAGRPLDWALCSRPGNRPYVDQEGGPACVMKAVGFQVVDWCVVGSPAAGAGAELLRPAYEAWYRWPEAAPVVAGDFVYHERKQRQNAPDAYDSFTVKGGFTLSADRILAIDQREGHGVSPRALLVAALENLRRPDFATLGEENELVPVAADRVALRGKGWDWNRDSRSVTVGGSMRTDWLDLQVADGRIVGDGCGDGPRTTWDVQWLGSRYVVTRRHHTSLDLRFSHAEQDGRIVPVAATSVTSFGGKLYAAGELRLSNLRFEGVQPIVPPPVLGGGAAALRAIWDGGFRLTRDPIEIAASFEVTHPGTDLVWGGHRNLRGKVVMRGIGRHLLDAQFTFDGALSDEVQMALGAVVRDRLGMWWARDFNARAPFDEFFAGATVQPPTADGVFLVDGGQVARVSTDGGLVRGWSARGLSRKFTWQKSGSTMAVVRIDEAIGDAQARSQDRWNASVQLVLQPFGPHLVPTRLHFERIFGRDWGPETLVLKDVVVR